MPLNAGEALQLQRPTLPLAAGSAGTIQRAQLGIDSAGVCLRAESVAGMSRLGVVGGSIFPGRCQQQAQPKNRVRHTYSLGFFLGPGLPRDLEIDSLA